MANLLLTSHQYGAPTYPLSYISTTATKAGYMTGQGTQLYYYINLKTIIGEEDYEKYDKFKLELIQFDQGFRPTQANILIGGASDATLNYQHLGFSISGLEFITNPYNNNNIIANYLLASQGVYNFVDNYLIFRKNDENVKLGIGLYCLYKNTPVDEVFIQNTNQGYVNTAYLFKITGLE